MQLLVVLNGKDSFKFSLPLPSGPTTASKWQYYLAGGAVSRHTLERHIQLVNAGTSSISWTLGSLQVLRGKIISSALFCVYHCQEFIYSFDIVKTFLQDLRAHYEIYYAINFPLSVSTYILFCLNFLMSRSDMFTGWDITHATYIIQMHCSKTMLHMLAHLRCVYGGYLSNRMFILSVC